MGRSGHSKRIHPSERVFCESCREYFPRTAITFHNSRVHQPRRITRQLQPYGSGSIGAPLTPTNSTKPEIIPKSIKKEPAPARRILFAISDPRNSSPEALLRCEDCPFSLFTSNQSYRAHRNRYHVKAGKGTGVAENKKKNANYWKMNIRTLKLKIKK